MFFLLEKEFVEKAAIEIKAQLIKMGVVIRKPEALHETILQICKDYHKLKQENGI